MYKWVCGNCRSLNFKSFVMILVFLISILFFIQLNPEKIYAEGNANLKGFTVKGGNSYPAFNKDTLLYGVEVSKEVTEVEITGIPEDPNAKVESPGKVTGLEIGKTIKKKIVVTSADGTATKTYSFYITRYDRIITPAPVGVTPSPQNSPAGTQDSANETQNTNGTQSREDRTPSVSENPETTGSPEASTTPVTKANNKKKNNDDKEVASKGFGSGDMAICIILSFLAGILIGYAIFFFSEKWKKYYRSKI